MDKKARITFYSIIFLSVLTIIIFIVQIGGQSEGIEQKQSTSQIIKRTTSLETVRNFDGTYTTTLYSGSVFMDDKTRRFQNYVPVSEVVNVSRNGTSIIIEWFENKIIITPKVKISNQEIDIDRLKTQFASNLNFDSIIIKNIWGYEYGYNISNLGLAKNLLQNVNFDFQYIGFNATLKNNVILLPDNLQMRFEDLNDKGFTFDISDSERLIISNVTGKDNLFLDPTITLRTANNENLKDMTVASSSPNTNLAGGLNEDQLCLTRDSSMSGSCSGDVGNRSIYISFNLSTFPSVFSVTQANFSLRVRSFTQGSLFNVSIHHVYDDWKNSSGNNILNETQLTWNNQPCGTMFDNDTNCNLTAEQTINVSTTGRHYWDVSNSIIRELISEQSTNVSYIIRYVEFTSSGAGRSFDSKEESTVSSRPYLNITYTPYINIILPTSSQILTDNTPTNRFNISTAVNMTTCLWTNSSGVINYSMASLNTTYFFNSSISNLLDGTHTVRFYCNQSDNGAWRTSDSVTFDIDSVNVTTCRDLTVGGRNYTLRRNILSSTNDCIVVTESDIGFNALGNNITTIGDGYSAFRVEGSNEHRLNVTLQDISTNATDGPGLTNGVYLVDSDNNTIMILGTINIYGLGQTSALIDDNNGLHILRGKNNNITINKIISLPTSDSTSGILLQGTNGNSNSNMISVNNLTMSDAYDIQGINFEGNVFGDACNNIIKDSSLNAINKNEIVAFNFASVLCSNNLTNVTYDPSPFFTETLGSDAQIIRQWYFTTQINNSVGVPLQNANITITNISNSIIISVLTDSNGQIPRQEIIEYINTGGTRNYHTPHTINVSLTGGYTTNSTTYNLTSSQNVFHRVTLMTSLSVDIVEPQPQNYPTNMSLSLNYTITNSTVLNTCWYYIFNSSNGYQITNTTITCNQNQTFNVSTDQTYTLHLHINETGGQSVTDSVTFAVSSVKPAVVLDYPSNNSYFNSKNNIYFNFTATDSNGLNTCQLYGDWTGTFSVNYTWIRPTNVTMNYTIINISQGDGTYNWNVLCNDTLNNENFALNNRTFTIDTVYPIVHLFSNNITTTQGSLSVSFNTSYTELNCNNTFYSIFDINENIDNNNQNVSITCGPTIANTFSVSTFASYNLQVYVRDKAGNENSTRKSFNVQQTGGQITTGGGGGTPSPRIPVIGIIQPEEAEKEFNELQREIIYAEINNFCSEKLKDEGLAIIDFSQECSLTLNNLEIIKQRLEELDIIISKEDLVLFYKNYKERKFFQGAETKETIDKYGLFSAVLGETVLLKFNPPSLDKFFSINVPDGSEHTISFKFTSNKPLKSCDIISNTPELSCIASNSSLIVFYKIANTDFIARIFSGTISGTTDAPQDKIETKNILLIFRVINIGVSVDSVFGIPIEAIPVYIFFIGGGILAIGLIIIFSVRKGKNPIKSLIKAVK